jgi:hypothetical protein
MDNKFKRYSWLIDTISRPGSGITFQEISRAWDRSILNDGKELSLRTFQEHKKNINELSIGVEIICDKSTNTYRIQFNNDDNNNVAKWLWQAMSVRIAVEENETIKDRIIIEEIPSAESWLNTVLHAIKENSILKIKYKPFGTMMMLDLEVKPYFVQLAAQRWYLFGLQDKESQIKAYALDRIKHIELANEKFVLLEGFSAEEYLETNGIGQYEDIKEQEIVVRAYGKQVDLLRTLPLHKSQQETKTETEKSEFIYSLKPTARFYSDILSRGKQVKILSPSSVQQKLKETIDQMSKYYK